MMHYAKDIGAMFVQFDSPQNDGEIILYPILIRKMDVSI